MSDEPSGRAVTRTPWFRIPDGIRVRHRQEGRDGVIDGLTEIVAGPGRNPDGRTQYRMDVGETVRRLAVEDDLLILTDEDGLVIMGRQSADYRRYITERLHGGLSDDRFVAAK